MPFLARHLITPNSEIPTQNMTRSYHRVLILPTRKFQTIDDLADQQDVVHQPGALGRSPSSALFARPHPQRYRKSPSVNPGSATIPLWLPKLDDRADKVAGEPESGNLAHDALSATQAASHVKIATKNEPRPLRPGWLTVQSLFIYNP